MADLTIIKRNGGVYIDSREVATIIEKPHNDLMNAIRKYCRYLNEGKIPLVDFYVSSNYEDSKGETRPCYLMTKMGCEMTANKVTGQKGVIFTAMYVKRFNELEATERVSLETLAAMPAPRLGEYNACARIIVRAMQDIGSASGRIVEFLKGVYEPLGISVISGDESNSTAAWHTAKQIAKTCGIYSRGGRPHSQAVSCILNEILCISDNHKAVIEADFHGRIGNIVRYDDYAAGAVAEWLAAYGQPSEAYGATRTFSIKYHTKR